MSLLLQRGAGLEAAPDAKILLRVGDPPRQSPGKTFSVQWTDTGPLLHFSHASSSQLIPMQVSDDGSYVAVLEDFGKLWVGRRPWWQVQNFDLWRQGAGCYLPFQGWWRDEWWDGPLFTFNENGLIDLVLPGRPIQLTTGLQQKAGLDYEDWVQEHLGQAWKDSLVHAFRLRWQLQALESYRLGPQIWNAATILSLLLFRISFPETRFILGTLPAERPEAWKRLAQNLNIEGARGAQALPLLPTEIHLGPPQAILACLAAIRKLSPFIPEQLWKDVAS